MESANNKGLALHILLVDDDEDDYLLTREMLAEAQRGKFTLDWKSSYEAGLEALLGCRYDAALVDFDMGARSGIHLVREAVSSGCTAPIIIFTGRGTYEVDVEAMQAGAMDYLSKGETSPALLERAIRYAIERSRTQQQLEAANDALSSANEQLVAGRQDLLETLGSIRDGFLSLDRDWRFLYINHIAAGYLGSEPGELIGKNIWELNSGLVGKAMWDLCHHVMQSRQPAHLELSEQSGSQRDFELRAYPSAKGITLYWIDITAQKTTERSLQRQRELLQSLFDNIPVFLNTNHPGDPIPQVNEYFTRMTGWTNEDLASSPLMELCYPDESTRKKVEDFIASQVTSWLDCDISTRSGEILQTSWTNLHLSDGTHVGIGIDISERKRAEQALLDRQRLLAERNQQIEALFENAPAALAVFEALPPYRLVTCNQLFQHALPEPFQSGNCNGHELREIFPSAQVDELLEIFEQVRQTGITRVMTLTPVAVQPDALSWWNWSLTPLREGGQIVNLAMLLVDVSQEVKTRIEIEQERALLDAVLEQMPSAVLVAEAPSGRLVMANQQAEIILRASLQPDDELPVLHSLVGYTPDGRLLQPHEMPLARALRDGRAMRAETMVFMRGDGTPCTFSVSAAPIHNPNGDIVAAVAILHDIDEQMQVERDTNFLLGFNKRVAPLLDSGSVISTVAAMVVEHLDAARCLFYELDAASQKLTIFDDRPGQYPSIAGMIETATIPAAFIADQTAGQAVIVNNAESDPRTAPVFHDPGWPPGLRSFVIVPLMRAGQWAASMLPSDARPRAWNDRQVAFLQNVAERAWGVLENRRLISALRENQDRYRLLAEDAQSNLQKLETIINNLSEAVLISSPDGQFIRVNPAALKLHGFAEQAEMLRGMAEIFAQVEASTPDGRPIANHDRPIARAARGETVLQFEMRGRRRDTGKQWIGLYTSIPVFDPNGALQFIVSTITDITNMRAGQALRSQMQNLLQTQHLLVAQREEERLQIARDIHDGPVQDMILLTYLVQSIQQANLDPDTRQSIDEVRERGQKLVADLREVCNQLRPPVLSRFGLAKAIHAHVDALRERGFEPSIILDLDEEQEDTLPSDVRLALFRIFQESMSNINHHAQARRVKIRLRIDAEEVLLDIIDNGVGFSLPDDWLTLARQGHLGLVGIKERADAIGGQLAITSKPGLGTRICIRLKPPS